MNKVTKISFCFLSIILILVSMCPLSAFAVQSNSSNTFYVPIQKPVVNDTSGYIEVLCSFPDYGFRDVVVISYSFSSYAKSDNAVDNGVIFPHFTIDRSNTSIQITVHSGSFMGTFSCPSVTGSAGRINYSNSFRLNVGTSYSVSHLCAPNNGYIEGVHIYGPFDSYGPLNGNSSVNMSNQSFFVNYSESSVITSNLTEVISSLDSILQFLEENSLSDDWEYDYSQTLSDILFNLQNLDATATQVKTAISDLSSLVQDVLDKLDSVVDKLDDAYKLLDDLYVFLEKLLIPIEYWVQESYWIEFDNNQQLIDINSKLDSILSKLEAYSDVTFPSRNNSELESYLDIENSLLDDSHIDPSKIFGDVTLNADAVQSVFGMFNDVVNVHPKIIGFIILVLGIGLVALILGR